MDLLYNNQSLPYEQLVPVKDFFQLQPVWGNDQSKKYTVAVYDIDAPTAENPENSPYLHALTVNIPGGMIGQGQGLIQTMNPSPASDSGEHRYVVHAFEQTATVPAKSFSERKNFDLTGFISNNGLQEIDKEFLVVNPRTGYFYRASPADASVLLNKKNALIRADSLLTAQEQRYCSCVPQVAEKNAASCNEDKAWFETRDGKKCYNPYAVCTSSVGTNVPSCKDHYNYSQFTDGQLKAMANLDGISVPIPFNRQKLIDLFNQK